MTTNSAAASPGNVTEWLASLDAMNAASSNALFGSLQTITATQLTMGSPPVLPPI